MDNKVIIPKDVAEAIEHVRNAGYTNFTLINVEALRKTFPGQHEILEYYNGTEARLNNYLLALVNGYTIEQTPEEKVREYYTNIERLAKQAHSEADHEVEFPLLDEMNGILQTLDILGIKIEGINA